MIWVVLVSLVYATLFVMALRLLGYTWERGNEKRTLD